VLATHVGGEAAVLVTDHWELPAAACCEAVLRVGRIGACDEGGAIGDMQVDAVETVRPKRALWAGAADVVDHEQVSLLANSCDRRTALVVANS
jgi:hypothetical protein